MMRDQETLPRDHPSSDDHVREVVDGLVVRHVITPEQAGQLVAALSAAPGEGTSSRTGEPAASGRGHLTEVAGYLGGALVTGAAGLFLVTSWAGLATAARVATVAGLAVVLAVAGVALCLGTSPAALRNGEEPVRRRLISTLWVLAAWSASWAAQVWAEAARPYAADHAADLVAAVVLLTASAAAYLLVPSMLGQLSAWAGTVGAVGAAVLMVDEAHSVLFAVGLVGVGLVWAVLALTGIVRERESALVAAAVAAIAGAQVPLAGGSHALAYALTAAVAVTCFAGYLQLRGWSLLSGGMVATTLVVPEAADGLARGSLPVIVILLVAGVTLLLASALGLGVGRTHDSAARRG